MSNNNCSENFWCGLRIEGESGHVTDSVHAFNNICKDNKETGICIRNASSGDIYDNISEDNLANTSFNNASVLNIHDNAWN